MDTPRSLHILWRWSPIPIPDSISITAALHGASRLRNSTPLSKTHHSNAHLLLFDAYAFCCSFSAEALNLLFSGAHVSQLIGNLLKLINTHQRQKTKQTRGTSNCDSIFQKRKLQRINKGTETECLRLIWRSYRNWNRFVYLLIINGYIFVSLDRDTSTSNYNTYGFYITHWLFAYTHYHLLVSSHLSLSWQLFHLQRPWFVCIFSSFICRHWYLSLSAC